MEDRLAYFREKAGSQNGSASASKSRVTPGPEARVLNFAADWCNSSCGFLNLTVSGFARR